MFEERLNLLASAFAIDIFKYDQGKLVKLSAAQKFFNQSLMTQAAKSSALNTFTLVKYQLGYILVIAFSDQEKLLLLPQVDSAEYDHNSFADLNFLTQALSLGKLVYSIYKEAAAPDWELAINDLNKSKEIVKQSAPIKDLNSFHAYSIAMTEALCVLDQTSFQKNVQLMKACNILGEALKSNNFIRGEKDILIGLVEQMTNGLEKIGFPIEKAVLLQINANQKIEMQANIINFDYWLDELTQLFFVELKKYRQSQSLSKAEKISAYINAHLRENTKLKTISENLNIPEQSLNIIFKNKYGQTIKQYAIAQKIEKAKTILDRSELKVKDIANYLYFIDESYFISTFKKLTGITPLEYRLKASQPHEANKSKSN